MTVLACIGHWYTDLLYLVHFVYDGRRVHPHAFRAVLARHPEVVEYQVRQTAHGARIAVRCGAPADLDRIRAEIADALAGLGVPRATVDVTAVERLERDPGPAKLRRFVPLSAEPVLSAAT
jgi:hypothetical protein